MNPTEDQEWRERLRAHDRTLLTAIVSVLLLYLIGLVAVIRSAFRPREDNLKTLQGRLKDSGHYNDDARGLMSGNDEERH